MSLLRPYKSEIEGARFDNIFNTNWRVRIEGISDPTPKRKPSSGVGHKTAGIKPLVVLMEGELLSSSPLYVSTSTLKI